MAKKIITPPAYPTDNNQSQPRQPTLSYQAFQLLLDQVGIDTKAFIESMIAELQDSTGSKGSGTIGHDSASVTADNVEEALEENRQATTTLDGEVVKTTGDQSIAGVKTYSSSPIVPETPTTDTQTASKGYVDTVVADAVLGAVPDNSLTEQKMAAEMKKQAGGVLPYDIVGNSFSADADRYRRANTKLVDSFQDESAWSVGTANTTDVKIGSQNLRLLDTGGLTNSNNLSLNLEELDNGDSSGDDDYIVFVFNVEDIAMFNVSSNALQLQLGADATFSTANRLVFNIADTAMVTGYNYLKLAKSQAVKVGTVDFNDIKSIRVNGSFATSSGNTLDLQLIQLVKKDPTLSAPNPFQRNGVAEFDINDGEWFNGGEYNDNVIKGFEATQINALLASDTFDNFIISGKISNGSAANNGYLSAYKDGSNSIIASIVSDRLRLRKFENGVDSGSTYEVDFPIDAFDEIEYTLVKSGVNVSLRAVRNGKESAELSMTVNETYMNSLKLAIGSITGLGHYTRHASITEIAHAHHADVAETSKDKPLTFLDNTLSSASWVDDTASGTRPFWYYQIDLPVLSTHMPEFAVNPKDKYDGKATTLTNDIESFDGYVRIYALAQPGSDFDVNVWVVR